MVTSGVLLGDIVARRYLVTARLGACAGTVFAAAQSLPDALADHGTSEVMLRVFVGNSARERAAFARASQADPRILDFGHLDDGRLYSAVGLEAAPHACWRSGLAFQKPFRKALTGWDVADKSTRNLNTGL